MPELTPSQKTAVTAEKNEILVSAAAGAGKTMVMTERIVYRAASGIADTDNILVMTFTDAAAKSMKERIYSRFSQLLADARTENERARISRCIRKLPQASVSTIHSFCLDVIRNFYYEAVDGSGRPILEPGFRIEEPGEADTLLSMSTEEIFSERYELCDTEGGDEGSKHFIRLVESFGGERSDAPLREMVRDFIHFIRSMPDHDEWMRSALNSLASAASDFPGSEYCRILTDAFDLRLKHAIEGLSELESFLMTGPKLYAGEAANEQALSAWKGFIQSIRSLAKLRENPGTSWDDIYYAFCITPEPDTFKGRMSEDRKILRSIYSRYFAELIFMGTGKSGTATYTGDFLFDTKHVFCSDAFGIQMDLRYMYAVVNAFFELAGDVICRYSEMKRELNMIDFSDFEHYALLLLRKPDIGEYYRQRYKEIYIDEYQDTSSIQEAVISLVSGGSIFMVGDVKQSIYRFRHARPEIFLDKMLRSCIELNENFRSLGGIIAASNSVFLQLMSKEAGEIDYGNGHELIPGREGAEVISEKVTILLTDIGETPDVDDAEEDPGSSGMSRYEKEACTVALEAAKLLILGEKPGDIVVLARTGNICRAFAEIFEKAGLPVIIEKSDPSPDIYELKILESLMNIIDNPRQDIHLAAVMRSPVFAGGFDENELLTIRTECKDKDAFFYECVDEYLLEGSDAGLKKKTADFISELERLRKLALCLQPGDLLDLVVRGSGLEAYAAAMPDPGRRSDLMHRFTEWVRAFTQARHCGIHEAVIHLSELKEKGIRELPFAIEESTEDRIKIMTIHKSKGLQYKTVFLVGTSSRFRTSDSRGSLIYSADGLPGVWMIEPDKQYKYPTPTVFAAAEMVSRKDIAEEMRLMYVAMTRAKDRLFISGVTAQKSTCPLPDRIPAPHIVLSAKSMLDWVLMSVAGNPHVDMSYFGIPAASDACRSSADKRIYPDCWDLRIADGSKAFQTITEAYDLILQSRTKAEDPQDQGKRFPETDAETEEDKAYIEKLRNRFFGNYRFEQAVKTPLKLSVSEIKRKWTTEDESTAGINLTVRKLDLSEESRLSASEKGTAVHSFIRYVQIPDFDGNVDEEMIISRIGEMNTTGILDHYECEYLKNYSGHLKAYFSSPLADRIRNAYMKNRSNVLREVPFTLALPFGSRDDTSGYAQSDFQLVQGMIDCWFIEGDKAVVADYKTDNISGDDETILTVLRQRYGTQLRIYSEAVERICSLKVEKAVIWLFSVDKEFIIC